MWVPKDAPEIEDAARRGEIAETASFDAKEALPSQRKNSDVAIDVAAMTTDGGVLVYGLAEDGNKRLTVPRPFELAGVPERIDQIVRTSIAEPPFIEIRALPTDADPAKGYIVVVVPQSARAPHQVTVGGDLRYYGRGPTGNRRLMEGDIARLYDRRHAWEIERGALLNQAIAAGPGDPPDDLAYMYAFTRPLPPERALWQRASRPDRETLLRSLIAAARTGALRVRGYKPDLREAAWWERRGADAWKLDTGERDRDSGLYLGVRCELNIDGRGWLFCARAAAGTPSRVLAIMDQTIAGNLAAFLSAMGKFYETAGYHGHLDLGVAVIGIDGGVSVWRAEESSGRGGYDASSYTRADRVSAAELLEPVAVARGLLREFMDAIGGASYDPFDV